jgi:uncharacterized protein
MIEKECTNGNRLSEETSPYLLQHKDNPVHWLAWNETSLALARAAGKPILLSIGYSACHWCHVMAHESFEDVTIAALMNKHFINVKVDREERPDIDLVYQQALSCLGQAGGWPLTMFLDPLGVPFWGGTYFPPQRRWGRPGFADILRAVADAWTREPLKVRRNADAIAKTLKGRHAAEASEADIAPSMPLLAATRLAEAIDPIHGGIGGAPKFPQIPLLELIWRGFWQSGEERLGDAVRLTLDRMCQGGIYDHLAGGFARYSVDDAWLVPHFEKMLYDNALIIHLLALVAARDAHGLFKQRLGETVAWLLRDMRLAETNDDACLDRTGGFASSLDADSAANDPAAQDLPHKQEGAFYIWRHEEIIDLLGSADGAFFCRAYGVVPEGNWEGQTILHRLGQSPQRTAIQEQAVQEEEARLAPLRARLAIARARRHQPARDDKLLTDWNGLTIAALAKAGSLLAEETWVDAAKETFDLIAHCLDDGEGGLLHTRRSGISAHHGILDDYAAMIMAALRLYEASGDTAYLRRAEAWAACCERRLADHAHGGYFLNEEKACSPFIRPRHAEDHATPSGNGLMVEALVRLATHTGKAEWQAAAERQVKAFSAHAGRNPFALATYLCGVDLYFHALHLVIVGADSHPGYRDLRRIALSCADPCLIVSWVESDPLHGNDEQPGVGLITVGPLHPAHGKRLLEGRATAYLCHQGTCGPPITDPESLAQALMAARHPL